MSPDFTRMIGIAARAWSNSLATSGCTPGHRARSWLTLTVVGHSSLSSKGLRAASSTNVARASTARRIYRYTHLPPQRSHTELHPAHRLSIPANIHPYLAPTRAWRRAVHTPPHTLHARPHTPRIQVRMGCGRSAPVGTSQPPQFGPAAHPSNHPNRHPNCAGGSMYWGAGIGVGDWVGTAPLVGRGWGPDWGAPCRPTQGRELGWDVHAPHPGLGYRRGAREHPSRPPVGQSAWGPGWHFWRLPPLLRFRLGRDGRHPKRGTQVIPDETNRVGR